MVADFKAYIREGRMPTKREFTLSLVEEMRDRGVTVAPTDHPEQATTDLEVIDAWDRDGISLAFHGVRLKPKAI
jgi:hypothetical protein